MSSDATSREPPAPFRIEGRPLSSARDVADMLGADYGQMLWILYTAPDTYRYRHFEIPKRTGGMRQIHAPQGRLRDLQDRLKLQLDAVQTAHPSAHGFIAGRGILSNAEAHTGRRWVFNVDLDDFFPTINFGRVRGLFMRPPFDMAPAAATVVAQIVTFRNGLPQGAPTSPSLSNFIATALDRKLLRLARQHRLAYSRYADDITFSTDASLFPPAVAVREESAPGTYRVTAGDALVAAIEASGFRINERKVRLQGRGVRQSVTGITVNTRLNVDRERVRKVRAMLHAWDKFGLSAAAAEHVSRYRSGAPPRGEGGVEKVFRNVVYGNLSFVKMVRGADDPVFLKLCAKLLELDPTPSKFLRRMVFGADDFDVFISHASEDKEEIARPLFAACERLGIKAFLDEAHIGWGENFTKKINTALGAARTILVVVSSNSVSKDWPLAEINTALAFEVEGKKRVLAVVVGKPDLTKLPLIKTKNHVTWTGDAEAVARRLRALLPGRPGPGDGDHSVSADLGEATSVPTILAGAQPADSASATDVGDARSDPASAAPAAPRKRGFLRRIFGRRE